MRQVRLLAPSWASVLQARRLAAACLILLAGCSGTQQDWRAAQRAGTPQAYQVFLERHPHTELAGIARQRIAQLTEETAWQQATRENTAAAYQDYLTKYPNGSWSQDARIRMESRSMATPAAPGAGPITPAAGAAVRTPGWPDAGTATPPRKIARPAAAAAGGGAYAVQLGAFSTVTGAHGAWTQLSSRLPSDVRGLTPRFIPVTVSGRRLYRLEAQVPSEASARRLCLQLQQHSQPCLPVP